MAALILICLLEEWKMFQGGSSLSESCDPFVSDSLDGSQHGMEAPGLWFL